MPQQTPQGWQAMLKWRDHATPDGAMPTLPALESFPPKLAYAGKGDAPAGEDGELEALFQMLDLDDPGHIAAESSSSKRLWRPNIAPAGRTDSNTVGVKKCWMYKNSRLPPGMLPFKCYVPTWTLICRAAKAALDVYEQPRTSQNEIFVGPDPKARTKAMIIKAQPIDDRCLVVVAIRGSQVNKFDWSTNLRWSPVRSAGFLDDEGNACHGGFLDVANQMAGLIAGQLERTFEQDPDLAGNCSLVFTGHSAGGAVASLLYCHMLGKRNRDKLTDIAGSSFFRRIHCITFGSPPVSLLPLQKPVGKKYEKYIFYSFINEGDPVVRMDNQNYLMSLARLIARPAPCPRVATQVSGVGPSLREKLSRRRLGMTEKSTSATVSSPQPSQLPSWPVPPATLSNAGRLILLREKPHDLDRSMEAVVLSDEQLRHVIFGDRDVHFMAMYKQRVDELAFVAMSGA